MFYIAWSFRNLLSARSWSITHMSQEANSWEACGPEVSAQWFSIEGYASTLLCQSCDPTSHKAFWVVWENIKEWWLCALSPARSTPYVLNTPIIRSASQPQNFKRVILIGSILISWVSFWEPLSYFPRVLSRINGRTITPGQSNTTNAFWPHSWSFGHLFVCVKTCTESCHGTSNSSCKGQLRNGILVAGVGGQNFKKSFHLVPRLAHLETHLWRPLSHVEPLGLKNTCVFKP